MKTTVKQRNWSHSAGFSIVELMVAMALGLIVTFVVGQIFLANKQTNLQSSELGRIQEAGRFAMEIIGTDVRMAGYVGCLKDAPINSIASGITSLDLEEGIHGYTDTSAVSAGVLSSGEAKPGTAVLAVRRADSLGAKLVGNLPPNNANIEISDNKPGLVTGDLLVLSDCKSADVFYANSVSSGAGSTRVTHTPGGGNTDSKLSKSYGENSELMRFVYSVYFIGNNSASPTPAGVCPLNTLCRKTYLAGVLTVQELVPDVEQFDVSYGVDTTDDTVPDKYIGNALVSDWKKVLSAQVNLLVRSGTNKVTTDKQVPYWYKGALTASAAVTDRYLRRGFTQVFTVRNRVN